MSADEAWAQVQTDRERRIRELEQDLHGVQAGNGKLAEAAGSHAARLDSIEKAQSRIEGKVDTLTMVLVGFAVTVAGSAIGLALTLGGHP